MSIVTPSKEELDRLGDGFSYTVESWLKETTTEEYVRNWGKNFRIGVFNNQIESNNPNIYTKAAEQSKTDPGGTSTSNSLVITNLSRLPQQFELSFDLKAEGEMRFGFVAQTSSIQRTPDNSVFIGTNSNKKANYGYRTTSTTGTEMILKTEW